MNTFARLLSLSSEIASGRFGKSNLWQGADVVVTSELPISTRAGFYPEPRYVITSHAAELSWLFEQIRNIYIEIEDYGLLKEEIFGRLGNTANRFLAKNPDADICETLLAVIHEAFAVAEEIRDGEFATLLVATGNQVLDDLISESENTGFLTIEETQKFFKDKGIIE
jgi:hypothetical protein